MKALQGHAASFWQLRLCGNIQRERSKDCSGDMRLMDFLRMFGKDARNGTMLASDSRRRWLESKSGISFTELCFQQHAD